MIKILIATVLLIPPAILCQGKDEASASKQKTAGDGNTHPDGMERVDKIPAGAVEVRDDVYRLVDKDGKVWIYRRMVFGMFRALETENMKQLLANPPDLWKVRELPDGRLEFSRNTPFGPGTYVRKKDELTDEEKDRWAQAKARDAAEKKKAKEQKK